MRRSIAAALAAALLGSGCVTRMVKEALQEETRASLTVRDDGDVVVAIHRELTRLHKVEATIKTVEKGVTILKIVGAYAAVVEAITWLIMQNLRLLANDEVTESLLAVALSAMK